MADNTTIRPSIARVWRGRTPRDRADEYEVYDYEAGIKPLIDKAFGVQTFREDRDGETEFVTISYWASIEAMSAFTGSNPTDVHHLERDPEFLRAAGVGADPAAANRPRRDGVGPGRIGAML